MVELCASVLAIAAGALLGAFFFGGLWWTIRRSLGSNAPGVWFLGSLLLRTLVVVGGFYMFSRQNWRLLLACLLGFSIARVSMMCFTRAPAAEPAAAKVLS